MSSPGQQDEPQIGQYDLVAASGTLSGTQLKFYLPSSLRNVVSHLDATLHHVLVRGSGAEQIHQSNHSMMSWNGFEKKPLTDYENIIEITTLTISTVLKMKTLFQYNQR